MVGTITLSLELELAWGLVHSHPEHVARRFSPGRQREAETLDRLLSRCDDLDIPLSVDVVGHLLLASCDGDHDGPHPDGWFAGDPGTDWRRDPLYYAPDLVEEIVTADVDHEICTHTFSHARCDEVATAVIEWELDRVEQLHARQELDPVESFVPPVHARPPRTVLTDRGIRTVRRPVEYRPPVEDPDPPDEILDRVRWYVRRSHPVETLLRRPTVASPRMVDGLVETQTDWHASLSAPYLPNGRQQPHAIYRTLPRSLRQRRHRQYLLDGLREVAESSGAVHFWTHLFNLANDAQWPPVQSFLETLADYRDRGAIQVETMADLGRRVT